MPLAVSQAEISIEILIQRKSASFLQVKRQINLNKNDFRTSAQCVLCSVRCPCIFYDPVSDTIRRSGKYRGTLREEGVDTGAYLGKKARIQGHILGEITNLEFQNHENVKKCTFRTLKQAGKNISSMGCQTQILR